MADIRVALTGLEWALVIMGTRASASSADAYGKARALWPRMDPTKQEREELGITGDVVGSRLSGADVESLRAAELTRTFTLDELRLLVGHQDMVEQWRLPSLKDDWYDMVVKLRALVADAEAAELWDNLPADKKAAVRKLQEAGDLL